MSPTRSASTRATGNPLAARRSSGPLTRRPRSDAGLRHEPYHLPASTVRAIARTKAQGARVVALGTTVTRALEHAALSGKPLRAGAGLATQRIDPHTTLRVVDAIISGTHEPGTSHYELLRAFVDAILRRASAALEQHGYRTHEFGDSVLIERQRRVVPLRAARLVAFRTYPPRPYGL